MTLFEQGLFFGFSTLLVGAALMTVFSRRVLHSAFSLVLAFFAAAALWIILQAEFLGLILVLVYVGAVMTLFLFVIMTIPTHELEFAEDINQNTSAFRSFWKQYRLPIGVLVGWLTLLGTVLLSEVDKIPRHPDYISSYVMKNNTQLLGEQLYTKYLYPFELAGILLLVAIIATISLCSGQKSEYKRIHKRQQIQIKREDRIQLVKMESVKS